MLAASALVVARCVRAAVSSSSSAARPSRWRSFPGYEVTSSFADGAVEHYAPRCPSCCSASAALGAAFVLTIDRRARARLPAAGRLRGARAPRRGVSCMSTAGLLISAAHKSSGKTTVSSACAPRWPRAGHAVQPFKKGPDYIDPMWLALAAGRACCNLDPYLMARAEIDALLRAPRRRRRHLPRRRQQGPVRRAGAGRQQQQRGAGAAARPAGAAGASTRAA